MIIIRHKFSYVNKIVFIKIRLNLSYENSLDLTSDLKSADLWTDMAGGLCWRHSRLASVKSKNILVANFMTWMILNGNNSGLDRRSENLIYLSVSELVVTIRHVLSYAHVIHNLLLKCWHPSPLVDHAPFYYLTVSVVLTWVSFAPPSTTKVLTQNVPSVTISFRFYFIVIHNHTWMFMSPASDHEAENISSTPGGPHNNWINEISIPKILDIGYSI